MSVLDFQSTSGRYVNSAQDIEITLPGDGVIFDESELKITGGTLSVISNSSGVVRIRIQPLNEGAIRISSDKYQLQALDKDLINNVFELIYDKTAPAIPQQIDRVFPANSPSNSTSLTLEVPNIDSGDNVKLYSDSACLSEVGSSISVAGKARFIIGVYVSGTYQYFARAIDQAGNASGCSSVSSTYVLDLNYPNNGITLGVAVMTSSPNTVTTPVIQVTGTTNQDQVQIYLDSNCATPVGSGQASGGSVNITSSALGSDGSYTYYARAVSSNGYQSLCSSAAAQYVLDRVAPAAPSLLSRVNPVSEFSTVDTPVIEVQGVFVNHLVELFSDSACTLSVGSAVASGATVQITTNSLTDGGYVFYARQRDLAGNNSPCSTANVAYNLNRSALTGVVASTETSPVYAESVPVTISFNKNIASVDGMALALVNAHITGLSFTGSTASFTLVPDAPGAFSVKLSGGGAVDVWGNSLSADTNQLSLNYVIPPAPELMMPLTFTWKSGSNTRGSVGTFGTKGVPSTSNTPPGRDSSVSWTASDGSLWLYSGYSQLTGRSDDMWRYNPATGEWTWMAGSSANSPGLSNFGTKGVSAASNWPGGRNRGMGWTDNSGKFWLFGGDSSGYLGDLWKFDPGTLEWTWIHGSSSLGSSGVYGTQGVSGAGNMPGARREATVWKDLSGNLWLFGGSGYGEATSGSLNDLWKFDPTTLEWTWVGGAKTANSVGVYGTKGVASPTNQPGARIGAVAWVDSSGKFWLFGGLGFDGSGSSDYLNDLWVYDPALGQWTWVSGSNAILGPAEYGTLGVSTSTTTPGSRARPSNWVDANNNLWLFGGAGGNSVDTGYYHSDLWVFSVSTKQWTWSGGTNLSDQLGTYGTLGTPSATNLPGGRGGDYGTSLTWHNSTNGKTWIFGGYGYDAFTTSAGELNDLWLLTGPAAGTMKMVGPFEVEVNSLTKFSAFGGTPPYSYQVIWGPGSIDSSTGNYTAPATAGYVILKVTDQAAGESIHRIKIWKAPDKPASIQVTSPGNWDNTPTLKVSPVVAGNTVILSTNASCSDNIGQIVATGSEAILDVNSLTTEGTYTFYARQISPDNHSSVCSSVFASYVFAKPIIGFTPAYTSGGGVKFIASSTLNMTVAISAGTPVQMQISEDSTCTSGVWQAYNPATFAHVLSAGDGAKNLSVKLKSADALETVCVATSLSVDTTAPPAIDPATISFFGYSLTNATPSVSFTGVADSGSGLAKYQMRILKQSDSSVAVPWMDMGLTIPMQATGLSLTLNEYFILEIRAVDNVGNVQSVLAQSTSSWYTVDETYHPAVAVLSGQPVGLNNSTVLNIDVSGTWVYAYKYKIGSAATTDCSVASGYSAETIESLNIVNNISGLANGKIRLCVVARNDVYIYQSYANATVVEWTKWTSALSVATTALDSRVAENAGTASIGFKISAAVPEDITVYYNVRGSAIAGSDHTLSSGSVTIPANSTTASINVNLLDDAIPESEKILFVEITHTNSNLVTLEKLYQHSMFIYDDDSGAYLAVQQFDSDIHACAVLTGGKLKCWGVNESGQIGNNQISKVDVPYTVFSSGVTEVKVSQGNTCAVMASGALYCWGANLSGQLLDGSTNILRTPYLTMAANVSHVAVQSYGGGTYNADGSFNKTGTICAILTTGELQCWGSNGNGQVGNGTTTLASTPQSIIASDVVSVDMGDYHTCAVLGSTGEVKCWGNNGDGQLGNNSTTQSTVPVTAIASGAAKVFSGAAYAHNCAIMQGTGELKCWGYNYQGQLGNGSSGPGAKSLVPISVVASGVTDVSLGGYSTCAVMNGGEYRCWGSGYTTKTPNTTIDTGVQAIAGSCILKSNGDFKCSGGIGTGNDLILGGVTDFFGSGVNGCAILAGGELRCWGNNDKYQVGDKSLLHRSSPVRLIASGVQSGCVGGGFRNGTQGGHICAIMQGTGELKCWGENTYGALGIGSTTSQSAPTTVISSGVAQVACGNYATCAVTTAGAVKCWGYNNNGQVGDGTTTNKSLPYTTIASGASKVAIAGDWFKGETACALMTTGELRCWGGNSDGQIGNNSTTNVLSPVSVIASGVTDVVMGGGFSSDNGTHVCALMDTTGMKCWGWGGAGNLGDNTSTSRLVPTDVKDSSGTGTLTGVNKIFAGLAQTCAQFSSGELQCWGRRLGTSLVDKLPVQIQASGVNKAQLLNGGRCVLNTANEVRCKGSTSYGLTGLGTNLTEFRTFVPNLLGP